MGRSARRTGRMERHHARTKGRPGFNVIALMDVFTVLVFFLLVNSSDAVDPLQGDTITLPEAATEQSPRDAVVVTITGEVVLLQGIEIVGSAEALTSPTSAITPLESALQALFDPDTNSANDTSVSTTGEVTIMADKRIQFALLKKVMTTCARAGFEQITLSVLQKPSPRS